VFKRDFLGINVARVARRKDEEAQQRCKDTDFV